MTEKEQTEPVKLWHEITEERYYDMLGGVPPIFFDSTRKRGWLCSEPFDHTDQGQPRFGGYTEHEGKYYETNGPVTRATFRDLLNGFNLNGYHV